MVSSQASKVNEYDAITAHAVNTNNSLYTSREKASVCLVFCLIVMQIFCKQQLFFLFYNQNERDNRRSQAGNVLSDYVASSQRMI